MPTFDAQEGSRAKEAPEPPRRQRTRRYAPYAVRAMRRRRLRLDMPPEATLQRTRRHWSQKCLTAAMVDRKHGLLLLKALMVEAL